MDCCQSRAAQNRHEHCILALRTPMDRPQNFVRTTPVALPLHTWLKPAIIALAGFVLLLAGWYAAQVVVLDYRASAAIDASVARVAAPLRPEDTIQVSVRGAGVQLMGAQLYRTDAGDNSKRSAEQAVPVRLEPSADEGTWQVVAINGTTLLATDGAYRLALRVAAPRPALPLPRTDVVERQYRFTSVPSPHAAVPTTTLQPRWAEPVSFTWSARSSQRRSSLPRPCGRGWTALIRRVPGSSLAKPTEPV